MVEGGVMARGEILQAALDLMQRIGGRAESFVPPSGSAHARYTDAVRAENTRLRREKDEMARRIFDMQRETQEAESELKRAQTRIISLEHELRQARAGAKMQAQRHRYVEDEPPPPQLPARRLFTNAAPAIDRSALAIMSRDPPEPGSFDAHEEATI
jgi:hypothetical protein